jgi:hypothetical protein
MGRGIEERGQGTGDRGQQDGGGALRVVAEGIADFGT